MSIKEQILELEKHLKKISEAYYYLYPGRTPDALEKKGDKAWVEKISAEKYTVAISPIPYTKEDTVSVTANIHAFGTTIVNALGDRAKALVGKKILVGIGMLNEKGDEHGYLSMLVPYAFNDGKLGYGVKKDASGKTLKNQKGETLFENDHHIDSVWMSQKIYLESKIEELKAAQLKAEQNDIDFEVAPDLDVKPTVEVPADVAKTVEVPADVAKKALADYDDGTRWETKTKKGIVKTYVKEKGLLWLEGDTPKSYDKGAVVNNVLKNGRIL